MEELILQLKANIALDAAQVEESVRGLVSAEVAAEAKAEFLRALRAKGETASEITAFVRSLLKRAVDPEIDPASLPGPMLDVCGTGGDRMDLFNVSTTSMFILAAGGACVVKHGNRAITSQAGGADVLEAVGIRIELEPAEVRASLERTGMAFLFAPKYHPAFREIAPVRKQLATEGIPTIFNMLGPLLNPAQPAHQLVGVFSEEILARYCEVLQLLGRTRAWAVCGASATGYGMDEVSTLGPTLVREIADGIERDFTIVPEFYQISRAVHGELRGGDKTENAEILEGILGGKMAGAKADVVLMNAAAGFIVAGLARDMHAGLELARAQIDSGRASQKLQELQRWAGA